MFDELDECGSDTAAILDRLTTTLRETKQYHQLFDAVLMARKHELGLPTSRPGSLEDVPQEHRDAVEATYIEAAREVGHLLLEDGKIGEAWAYLRTIRETDAVRAAIEQCSPGDDYEKTEELINIALYEGAHPVRGLELLLDSHGTCNSVTAMDQQLPGMDEADRQRAAAVLVRRIHTDLRDSVLADIRRRSPETEPLDTLAALIAGRDWLFENNNYHVDVSHLNSIVRFARSLDKSCPELTLALDLTEYGRCLDGPLQYPGEAPFDQFYEAHFHFFRVLAGTAADASLAWFRKKLAEQTDDHDRRMTSYVLVDLLRRVERYDDAVHYAAAHLRELEDPQGFSFTALCHEAGAYTELKQAARANNDPVGYVGALLADHSGS